MIDYFKYQLNEEEWTIYLIDDEDEVIADENAAALTLHPQREMYFRKGELSTANVEHELWHVYFGYCFLDDTSSITLGDMEEVSAAMFVRRGRLIQKHAETILKRLIEMRDL